ncbi:helix-turn-helix domain-containing protein [Cognatiyoonia sp. IB215446]|uniref:TetR/AcrR family transcriptional regulator n=1 Tax=Cognatiyoonia sp. IB215446 TaxID=3097355 RepID=UPI002A179093|nr:helix-turn-helix domain-containing protein [Cognatiyoonia sp. IB215446]MDX8348819.1 helix-turn-helix domain-containing protein [Cognatiyoonia sp. IB215446]
MQEEKRTRSNKSRTDATRAALMKAARDLFSQKGYAETSTPEVVKAAGVTRGALYHHFEDKVDLFRAIVTEEYQKVAAEITASAKDDPKDAIDALRQGSRGFLAAMKDHGRVRIMLLDGPAVLGRAEIDRIDRETSADALRLGLEDAMEAKQMKTLPVQALTVQLSALFDRSALAISEGEDRDAHLEILDAIFETLA